MIMSFLQRLWGGSVAMFSLAAPAILFLCSPSTVFAEQAVSTGAVGAAGSGYSDAAQHLDSIGSHHHDEHDPHRHHQVPAGLQRSQASYTVPEVTLINQDGKPQSLPALLDTNRPVMLNFIFTSCTAICPAMSATFSNVQTQLGSDSDKVLMISVSIDPEYDTPEALSAYARRFDAGQQWQFLTGSLDDSIAVQRAFEADRGDKMNHAPLTLLRAAPESQWVR
jgi:protein SCO1/2